MKYHFHKFQDNINTQHTLNDGFFSPNHAIIQSEIKNNDQISKDIPEQDDTSFQLDAIINTDFISEINSKNLKQIEKLLPYMLSLQYSTNQKTKLLISTFKVILNFLFNSQENLESTNSELNEFIKSNSNDSLKDEIEQHKVLIKNQKKIISNLKKKCIIYQTILNANKEKLGKLKKIYFCDVCPYAKFNSYSEFHKHYIKFHIDPNKKENYYKGFDQMHFDNEINVMEKDLKQMIINDAKIDDEELDEENESSQKEKNSTLNNINIYEKRYENWNRNQQEEIIEEEIDYELEKKLLMMKEKNEQKFKEFTNKFNDFKVEIMKSLEEFEKNQK